MRVLRVNCGRLVFKLENADKVLPFIWYTQHALSLVRQAEC